MKELDASNILNFSMINYEGDDWKNSILEGEEEKEKKGNVLI